MTYYPETLEQIALIDWSNYNPILVELLFHPANGEKREKKTAALLKRMGVKPGIPDLFLAYPNNNYPGLFIEMKSKDGRVTEIQKNKQNKLREVGYKVENAFCFEEGQEIIIDYLR